jgi:hypothetical protein
MREPYKTGHFEALPIGRNVNGVVLVHGQTERPAEPGREQASLEQKSRSSQKW